MLQTAGFSSLRLQRLDAAMQQEIDAGRYAGIGLMIARHGKVIKDSRYGYQDLETAAPLRRDAIFQIASMTKPVTGAALMILFEEGKWQLDDSVAKFIPEFGDLKVATAEGLAPQLHPMTMRELLTSTAGFPATSHAGSLNPAVNQAYGNAKLYSGTLAEMVTKISTLTLEAQPGTRFRYGIQHDIQAAVVERISGHTFDQFLTERLFNPLKLDDTGFRVPQTEQDRIAPLYGYDPALRLVPVIGQDSGEPCLFFSGALGLYSTLSDYMRFALMLANGGELDGERILAPSTVRLMTSDMLPEGVRVEFQRPLAGIGYGADLGIVLDPARASFNSGGLGKGSVFWTGAHGTWFWIDPVSSLVVVGMVQQELAGAAHMGMASQAPDIRALSRSLIYQALVEPGV